MQAIGETVFDLCYLIGVIVLGVLILRRANGRPQFRLLGVMAIVLGCGDAFHLLPRAWALCTDGLAAHTAALGVGKAVTSITMTVFYLLLYYVWLARYRTPEKKPLTWLVWAAAVCRVLLCLMPGNRWTDADAPLSWGVYRNIPFLCLGVTLIVLWYTKRGQEGPFRRLWLAAALSFAFYIPVVLLAGTIPIMGMLMLPKTVCYFWMILMAWKAVRLE